MKKIMIGVLSLGLVIAGGVTAVYAQSSSDDMPAFHTEPMMDRNDMNDMHQMMHNESGIINFGQMKNVMEEFHQELTKEEIKEMYNAMHGTNGAAPSENFKRMDEN